MIAITSEAHSESRAQGEYRNSGEWVLPITREWTLYFLRFIKFSLTSCYDSWREFSNNYSTGRGLSDKNSNNYSIIQ
jgi:hypothetical protein